MGKALFCLYHHTIHLHLHWITLTLEYIYTGLHLHWSTFTLEYTYTYTGVHLHPYQSPPTPTPESPTPTLESTYTHTGVHLHPHRSHLHPHRSPPTHLHPHRSPPTHLHPHWSPPTPRLGFTPPPPTHTHTYCWTTWSTSMAKGDTSGSTPCSCCSTTCCTSLSMRSQYLGYRGSSTVGREGGIDVMV